MVYAERGLSSAAAQQWPLNYFQTSPQVGGCCLGSHEQLHRKLFRSQHPARRYEEDSWEVVLSFVEFFGGVASAVSVSVHKRSNFTRQDAKKHPSPGISPLAVHVPCTLRALVTWSTGFRGQRWWWRGRGGGVTRLRSRCEFVVARRCGQGAILCDRQGHQGC